MPVKSAPPTSIVECLNDAERRRVLLLQLYGLILMVGSAAALAVGAWYFTPNRISASPSSLANFDLFAGAGFLVGRYCFIGASGLFGRFDFESVLYWIECHGNYQIGNVSSGNFHSSRLHTQKNVVNMETATLRVWVVELRSVVFGKTGRRFLRSMMGRKGEAQELAESLAAFAREQSLVIAPTAQQDQQRLADVAGRNVGVGMARDSGGMAIIPLEMASVPNTGPDTQPNV